ncbi:hypothetical protein MY867_08080, partial [Haemophilus influenzae]
TPFNDDLKGVFCLGLICDLFCIILKRLCKINPNFMQKVLRTYTSVDNLVQHLVQAYFYNFLIFG